MESKKAGWSFHSDSSVRRYHATGLNLSVDTKNSFGQRKDPKTLIPLKPPSHSAFSLDETIKQRRSFRDYSEKPIASGNLSALLWAAQGITGERRGRLLRAAPSGGGLYPFDLYLFIQSVQGFEPGLYRYHPKEESLSLIEAGDFRKRLYSIGFEQELFLKAGMVFVLASVFQRTCSKYGLRGYRYLYMEAGHISENIFLQATALGLGSAPVGAFFDEELNELLALDGERQAAIYLHAVGSVANQDEKPSVKEEGMCLEI